MAIREGGSGGKTGNTLLAFALGALAGAVVALLYAPSSGEETRRKLRDKAKAGRDRVAGLADDGRDYLRRQRENVADAMEHGREVFEQVKREPFERPRSEKS